VDAASGTVADLRQPLAIALRWCGRREQFFTAAQAEAINLAQAIRPDATDNERTARLLEQLMQIARVSALEEMASGFAHELNQPIGAIATFASAGQRMLAAPEPALDGASEVLQHIRTEALHAGEGIRRIRGLFSARPSEPVTCPLSDVLDELRPVLDLLAERAGVLLEVLVRQGLPPVSIDRLRVQHVLFTLVQNAIEASGGSSATVRIEMTGDRYGVVTAISDQGSGVPASAQNHLFRPFFTTKRNGTGLGLASSRAIIEAHEGAIGFEDAAGGGARFWFRLPASVSEKAP
jgi:signal transduction histidine kinase